MLNITFNFNVAARFFLITYGLDFVKKGQLQLKLYHQIYWIAWMDTVGKKMQQFSLFRSVVSIFGLTQDLTFTKDTLKPSKLFQNV